ncbi:MAG: GMC family oxidoreductase [Jatrophihabitantaceae bacterium]
MSSPSERPRLPPEVEVIVVGAGTAGCVLARRLVDRGLSVALFEAGYDDANPAVADPVRMHELWDSPLDWANRSVPQPSAHNRTLHLPRGRVVGGSHALNGMIWVRGHHADYDTWAYLGSPNWSWADVEPVFGRIESSGGGPQPVLADYQPDPVHRSIAEAAHQAGIPHDPNCNDGAPEGFSYTQLTVAGGHRVTTADSYLAPVRTSPLLHLVTGAAVSRLLFEGSRCVGVQWHDGAEHLQLRAGEQVILTAGALGSPALLLRSGVGDPDRLRPLGIDVVAPLRGVGRNLQDHWLVPVIFSTTRQIGTPSGLPHCQSHLFWRSRSQLASPDLQPIHFSTPLRADWMPGPLDGFTLMAGLVRPASRGSVTLADARSTVAPLVDPRVLTAPEDLTALCAAVRLCQQIGEQEALREEWGAAQMYPGTLANDERSLRDYVRETVVTYHHQSGTCMMGASEDSVVSSRLSVHGVDRLSVADASIMPTVTTGNTNAPTAMIAERAAQFLGS